MSIKLYEATRNRHFTVGTAGLACIFSLFTLTFALAGCQWLTIDPPPPLDNIELDYDGRMLIRSPDQNLTMSFSWESVGQQFQLVMRGRLGMGGVLVEGEGNSATLTQSNGEIYENVDLDTWISDQVGVQVPFLELWNCLDLDCSIIDESENKTMDEQGRLAAFSYAEWEFTIQYHNRAKQTVDTIKELNIQKQSTTVRLLLNR